MITKQKIEIIISVTMPLALFVKIMLSSLSISEAVAVVGLLSLLQVSRIIDYKFPKRPDLFSEVADYKKRIEELEHDVTALKFRYKP